MVNSVCRLSQSESSGANHSPNVENSAELSFVDETNSHHSGSDEVQARRATAAR